MTTEDAPWLGLRASMTGRLVPGGKLHAVVLGGAGEPDVLACDGRKVVPPELVSDYRLREWGRCRKKGCAAYFACPDLG